MWLSLQLYGSRIHYTKAMNDILTGKTKWIKKKPWLDWCCTDVNVRRHIYVEFKLKLKDFRRIFWRLHNVRFQHVRKKPYFNFFKISLRYHSNSFRFNPDLFSDLLSPVWQVFQSSGHSLYSVFLNYGFNVLQKNH